MTEEEPVSKIVFDEAKDFKFLAAYKGYSEAFDNASNSETKSRLNELITQLSDGEISYRRFYNEVNNLRGDVDSRQYYTRSRIQSQRKRAYRRDQQKIERIKRHKR